MIAAFLTEREQVRNLEILQLNAVAADEGAEEEILSARLFLVDSVRKVLENFKMPYITVTPLFSVCEKHGYLKGRHDYCPKCDEELLAKARMEEQPELPLNI